MEVASTRVVDILGQVLAKSLQILNKYSLCDSCLGRLFARLGHGIENSTRGSIIKDVLYMAAHYGATAKGEKDFVEVLRVLAKTGHKPSAKFVEKLGERIEQEACYLCGGLMRDVERFHVNVIEALRRYDFNNFEIGCRIPKEVTRRELEIIKEFELDTAESIKREINRRIGRGVRSALRKPVDKMYPDILAVVDVSTGGVDITPMPILIYTRYLKFCRGVSQAQRIQGVLTTVLNELEPIREYFNGAELVLHAAGREDLDVRTLGNGRPVIIEVKRPMKSDRMVDSLKSAVMCVRSRCVMLRVEEVRLARREEVRELKSATRRQIKLYRALILSDRDIEEGELRGLESMRGLVVVQKKPTRIKRKRVKARRRMVYEVKGVRITPKLLELYIRAQGGLYVKEFITGDYGRTTPSISEVLGAALEPIELDVLAVE